MNALLRALLALAPPLLAGQALAAPQAPLFADDFENGSTAWTLSGQWSVADGGGACTSQVAPFPSGSHVARFGNSTASWCTFNALSGRLATALPIAIPANVQGARLRFASFEETECGYANCGWDERYVRLSDDGVTWTTAWVGGFEGKWIQKQIDLKAYAGKLLWIAFDFEPVDPWLNDFVGWAVDDVRVEVDLPGAPYVYCTPKLNTIGCEPLMSFSGDVSLSGTDDLRATCTNLHNQTLAKFFWNLSPLSLPFDGGTLCVAPPAKRTTILNSGGTAYPVKDCSGVYTWHFSHAYLLANGVGAGDTVYVQTSARDYVVGNTHSLSDAAALPILP